MEIIVLSESPGVRAQRGPELFRSTDGTSEVRSVLLMAQPRSPPGTKYTESRATAVVILTMCVAACVFLPSYAF